VLGERVGLKLNGLEVPAHILVQYTDTKNPSNIIRIETTADGLRLSDKDFAKLKSSIQYEMVSWYEIICTKKETLAALVMNLGNEYLHRGDVQRASALHNLAYQASKRTPEILFSLAVSEEMQGNIENAERLYSKALLLTPRSKTRKEREIG